MRRGRKLILGLVGVLVVALALLILAPSLVTWGVGRGAIRGAIEGRINGTVGLQTLRVAWFGPQEVTGFSITGDDGRTSGTVDVRVDAGLLELLGGADRVEVDVAGAMHGVLREDGSTSFESLLKRSIGDVDNAARPGAAPSLAGLPATVVRLNGVDLTVVDETAQRAFGIQELKGELSYDAGEVKVDLQGAATGGARPGTVKVAGDVRGLADGDGAITPARTVGRLDVELRNVGVPLADRPTELSSMTLSASTDDPTRRIELALEANAVIDGSEIGHLSGALVADGLVNADGTLNPPLERITGELEGESVPTALLQRFLRGTGIKATRDLGPTLSVDARFGAGASREISLDARTEHAQIDFLGHANAEERSLQSERLLVDARVQPELLTALTGLHATAPIRLTVSVDELIVPPGAGDAFAQLASATVTGRIVIPALPELRLQPERRALPSLGAVQLDFVAPRLGSEAILSGETTVDGAAATVHVNVDELITADGEIAGERMNAEATVRINDIDPGVFAEALPEHRDLIEAVLPDPLHVQVRAERSLRVTMAEAELTSPDLKIEVSGSYEPARARLTGGRIEARVTPTLLEAFQPAAGQPVTLVGATEVAFVLEPVDVPWSEAGPQLEGVQVRGRLDRCELTLDNVPGLAAPVTIDARLDEVAARLGDQLVFTVAGEADLADPEQAFARARFDLQATSAGGGIRFDQLNADADQLDVARLDRVLGEPAGTSLAGWLGATGSLSLAAQREGARGRVELGADFPQLSGDFVADVGDEHITITGSELSTTVRRQMLQQRLRGVTVEADVPLALSLGALRIPRALALGEPLGSTEVDVEIALTGGPVVLVEPDLGRNTIEQVQIGVAGQDLAEGLTLTVEGDIRFEGAAPGDEAGELSLEGRVLELLDEQKRLNTAQALVVLDSTFRRLPTPLVDGLLDLEGLLTAAVGPRMDLQASARDFSRNGGRLDARIDTPNGWLEGRIRGRNDGLLIREDEGLRAELAVTPPLRERLLKKINPLLADIRTTEQPIRASLGRTIVPLDGDLTRLMSDLDVTVGAVEFDSGSIMLALVKVSRPQNASTFPGYVEPIKATIRKGVVRYETFNVRIDKYKLAFSGVVDLNTRAVDLRTEIPLEGLAGTFQELEGLADDLVVPLVTRGTLDNYKTEIEPEFLAEAGATIGIRKGLDELEKETGVPVGDIFDGLFGGKKKKKK